MIVGYKRNKAARSTCVNYAALLTNIVVLKLQKFTPPPKVSGGCEEDTRLQSDEGSWVCRVCFSECAQRANVCTHIIVVTHKITIHPPHLQAIQNFSKQEIVRTSVFAILDLAFSYLLPPHEQKL